MDTVQIDRLQHLTAVTLKPAVVSCIFIPVTIRTYTEAK